MRRGKRMKPRWCGELTRMPIRIRFRTDPDGSQKGWRVARTWLSLQTPHLGWRTRACGAIEAGLCLKIKKVIFLVHYHSLTGNSFPCKKASLQALRDLKICTELNAQIRRPIRSPWFDYILHLEPKPITCISAISVFHVKNEKNEKMFCVFIQYS